MSLAIGRCERLEQVVDAEACTSQGVDVIKRSTGGGSVLQTGDVLNYSLIAPAPTNLDLKAGFRPGIDLICEKELLEKEEQAQIDADRALLKDKFPQQVMLNIKMDVTKINPKDGKPYVYRSLPAGKLYKINNGLEYKIGNKLTLKYYECFVAVAISNTDLKERISAAKLKWFKMAKNIKKK